MQLFVCFPPPAPAARPIPVLCNKCIISRRARGNARLPCEWLFLKLVNLPLMDEQEAHELYVKLRSFDDGARQKRGLGFGPAGATTSVRTFATGAFRQATRTVDAAAAA